MKLLDTMDTKTDKWTLILSRIPLLREHGAGAGSNLYQVTDVQLNGQTIQCRAATLTMVAATPISLHLEIMPRSLEIIIEKTDG